MSHKASEDQRFVPRRGEALEPLAQRRSGKCVWKRLFDYLLRGKRRQLWHDLGPV